MITIPATLDGCNLNLANTGIHIRAWTWLRLYRDDARAIVLPISVLGATPQEAIDMLSTAAVRARAQFFDGSGR